MKARSFFRKLYDRARERPGIEDFVTEVIAHAVNDDAGPLLAILHERGLVDCRMSIQRVAASTQVEVDGAGKIDLVLQIEQGERRPNGWIEVKVHSAESGNQLENYRAFIAEQAEEKRPFLATLSKERLNPQVPALTWQELWAASLDSESKYWRDARCLLEEIEMADGFDAPIAQGEMVALSDAHAVLRKAVHVLQPVAQHVNAAWPAAALPTSRDGIRRMAAGQFVHNRFTIYSSYTTVYRTSLVLGMRAVAGIAELAIWLELDNPRLPAPRMRLLNDAAEAGLPEIWRRNLELGTWEALSAARRIEEGQPLVEHSNWLRDRVDELGRAGLLGVAGRVDGEPRAVD